MAYKLRFVQKFNKGDQQAFLALEQQFIELEKQEEDLAVAKRYLPVFGREPTNTLIWEAETETLEEAARLLGRIEANGAHDELAAQQTRYIRDYYTEILHEL